MDRTNTTNLDVSRRTVVRAGATGLLAFGGIGTVSAHDGHEGAEKDSEERESDDGENEENDGDEPSARITFPDQTATESVRVTDVSLSDDGYISIHDSSRFSGADLSDVEVIDELPNRANPICGSIVGISELLDAGEYEELEVPLYNEAAPAVGFYDHFPEQSLQESQPFIAIPHVNKTGEEEFVCGEDPPEDGAFLDGPSTVPSLGAVNDIATVLLESDDDEDKEQAEQLKEAILDGSIAPPSDDEDDEDEDEDEESEENDEEETDDKDDEDEEESKADDDKEDEKDEEDEDEEESDDKEDDK